MQTNFLGALQLQPSIGLLRSVMITTCGYLACSTISASAYGDSPISRPFLERLEHVEAAPDYDVYKLGNCHFTFVHHVALDKKLLFRWKYYTTGASTLVHEYQDGYLTNIIYNSEAVQPAITPTKSPAGKSIYPVCGESFTVVHYSSRFKSSATYTAHQNGYAEDIEVPALTSTMRLIDASTNLWGPTFSSNGTNNWLPRTLGDACIRDSIAEFDATLGQLEAKCPTSSVESNTLADRGYTYAKLLKRNLRTNMALYLADGRWQQETFSALQGNVFVIVRESSADAQVVDQELLDFLDTTRLPLSGLPEQNPFEVRIYIEGMRHPTYGKPHQGLGKPLITELPITTLYGLRVKDGIGFGPLPDSFVSDSLSRNMSYAALAKQYQSSDEFYRDRRSSRINPVSE